ncbi:hypothetical protein J7W19_22620 [Streptomyces mobaraensis NBRC 13819 = DSM 40847]|uniref:Uncharacterized protein n=2 Tax=Streptomyces mobaraensis TaxID=35621 RepID=A0A5N5WED7_STRMB|nr:hypothetical protein [Streptomyces mobaraensis]EME99370.1 hypothetical protein H340_16641 [Streptomyces mobaraensis NBRC 13819 = DSM 40847]KAB7851251.1 hypothetical protein FRZ00_03800 [Streptomyces mobaraensis]QTT75800.1 hypothetical protein J7W19_22620 [Streptomyces mobaraensis NBRC 13819 = DSM 40847]
MTDDLAPAARGRVERLLSLARTRDRYADYDVPAAEARLRARLSARARRTAPAVFVAWSPAWTEPAPGAAGTLGDPPAPGGRAAPDADRAWWDLTDMSLAVLRAPDAPRDLDRFIRDRCAGRTGARVFACLLHLADHGDGARFWWQFAAGAGDGTAEYCLFLDHSCRGEYHDAAFWCGELVRHGFVPDRVWGDRAAATAARRLPEPPVVHFSEHHDPDLGAIPLPEPPLVQDLRALAAAAP